MTNSFNDEHNSKALLFLGSTRPRRTRVDAAHAARQGARRKIIVVDPRFTRTARKADYFYRIRSGTDIPFIYGMLHHIFANGWEDKEYIRQRVYGMDKPGRSVRSGTPQAVKDVTAWRKRGAHLRRDHGKEPAQHHHLGDGARPSTRTQTPWCVRAASSSSRSATSACPRRAPTSTGHDNVQGATDVGPNADSLPAYYGLTPAAGSTGPASGTSTTTG